jgi:thiamine-phosphate pyrophosphorylase
MIGRLLPLVYPIVDTQVLAARGFQPLEFVAGLLEGGARLLQWRHKQDYRRADFELAEEVDRMCRRAGARLVIDDRADVALLLDAGVHVGQQDLAPRDARAVLGPERWVGFSTHNEPQVHAGDGEPVDYLALGPIFETQSKERPDPELGVAELARLRGATSKPLVAIGGITLETAGSVLGAGADAVAVIAGLVPDRPGRAAVRQRMEEWINATKR